LSPRPPGSASTAKPAQVDTKVVRLGGEKAYPYTALDDCTRLRVLRLYTRLHVRSRPLITQAFAFSRAMQQVG
jgi:hypothetical protein